MHSKLIINSSNCWLQSQLFVFALFFFHLPALEGEISVPFVCRCRRIWRVTQAAFLRIKEQNKHLADLCCTSVPCYYPGQKVWLSTKHIPLKSEPKKLIPSYISLFEFKSLVHLVSVQLKLPCNMKLHNMFYVSQVKSTFSRSLCPPFFTICVLRTRKSMKWEFPWRNVLLLDVLQYG